MNNESTPPRTILSGSLEVCEYHARDFRDIKSAMENNLRDPVFLKKQADYLMSEFIRIFEKGEDPPKPYKFGQMEDPTCIIGLRAYEKMKNRLLKIISLIETHQENKQALESYVQNGLYGLWNAIFDAFFYDSDEEEGDLGFGLFD